MIPREDNGSTGSARCFGILDLDCNVPRLLEKVRAAIVQNGPIHVLDMTFSTYWEGDKYVAEMTVYFVDSEG